ncbi:hypothetical protein ACWEK5_49090 [Rhodococcus koreensis]
MKIRFHLDITDITLTVVRDQAGIDAEAALDGIYTLRISVPAGELCTATVIDADNNLSRVEYDFRSPKAIGIDLRPIHHRLAGRVKGNVLICMLVAYLTWAKPLRR